MVDTIETTQDVVPGREQELPAPERRPGLVALRVLQWTLVAVIALSLPGGAVGVFGLGADRGVTADTVSVVFFAAYLVMLLTPWLPLRANRDSSAWQRIQSTCLLWFGLTYVTHLTWELGWLLLHGRIAVSPDSAWAYPWWMYIDGGDLRYQLAPDLLVSMEILSVINGVLGMTGLWKWWRSKGTSMSAYLLLGATAVVHLYSTSVYFLTEVMAGYPSVDTTSFVDFWIKFWLLNGLWLVVPWFVLAWCRHQLRELLASAAPEHADA